MVKRLTGEETSLKNSAQHMNVGDDHLSAPMIGFGRSALGVILVPFANNSKVVERMKGHVLMVV